MDLVKDEKKVKCDKLLLIVEAYDKWIEDIKQKAESLNAKYQHIAEKIFPVVKRLPEECTKELKYWRRMNQPECISTGKQSYVYATSSFKTPRKNR